MSRIPPRRITSVTFEGMVTASSIWTRERTRSDTG